MTTDIENLAKRLSGLGPELKRIADLFDDTRERQRLGIDKDGKGALFHQLLLDTQNMVQRLESQIKDFVSKDL